MSIFAQNTKTAYRVFAVELAPQLVCQFATKTNEENEPLFENMRLTLLTMVLKRCNDKAPTVRTRALTNLATIMSSPDAAYNAILARISKELVRLRLLSRIIRSSCCSRSKKTTPMRTMAADGKIPTLRPPETTTRS